MEPASVPVDKLSKYTAEELEGREKVSLAMCHGAIDFSGSQSCGV